MSSETIRRGFHVAGATNIFGMILISRGLTNDLLRELDPALFANPGVILICVWGLAYVALADAFQHAAKVALVFALEKAFYVGAWVLWLIEHGSELGDVWARDWLTGLFFSGYGLVDGAFGLFFLYVWTRHRKQQP